MPIWEYVKGGSAFTPLDCVMENFDGEPRLSRLSAPGGRLARHTHHAGCNQ
jgi:hypothetical protein